MKALRFMLNGKTAFFKKPEVNSYYYFTYGNIHKIALLGIFGAILGYSGYTKQYNRNNSIKDLRRDFPEFYEKLSQIKVSICPNSESGFFPKKIQSFNNSVGYASKEQGGNLIVKEQWLENPSWNICVLLDCNEADRLAEAIINRKCIYTPYLGKNDHLADILNADVEEIWEQKSGEGNVSSLFIKENAKMIVRKSLRGKTGMTYKYQECLPYSLDEWTNNYILKSFIYTDADVSWEQQNVYLIGQEIKMFY